MNFVTNPIDGLRIAYHRAGTGPAVVMIHGSALSHAVWREFGYVRDLAADHTVIALDLRGHGRSGKPHAQAAYRMELFVADVLTVLDQLEIDRADYLGYSLGGRIGFALADAYPERVMKFISAAGAPGNQPGAFDRIFFPGCIQTLESGDLQAFLATWQAFSGQTLDPVTRAAFATNDGPALAAYMCQSEREPGVPDSRLAGFIPPTLLLVGSEDSQRLGAAEQVRATVPRASLHVIPGATHADLLSRPEALSAVRAFLSNP